ncbi:MAG: hypothetical protein R2832_07680 [Rhodothermales bacterium]
MASSVAPTASIAQAIKFSGLVYTDYSYVIESPDTEEVGENGFGYRRLYFTTDAALSERFAARFRLEASDRSTTSQGNPAPYVKDLYVRWKNFAGEGHTLDFGVSSPPSFNVSEKFWGYRSLEKTILDLNGIVSSRDMGIAARGPLSGEKVRYGVMVANNSGVKAESDKNKRVYAQIELYPNDTFAATIGSDYATYSDDRDGVLNANVFAGVSHEHITAGVEGFISNTTYETAQPDMKGSGVSMFLRGDISERTELVGRFDFTKMNGSQSNYFIVGVGVTPDSHVHVIPNVYLTKDEADDKYFIAGRVTVHADF